MLRARPQPLIEGLLTRIFQDFRIGLPKRGILATVLDQRLLATALGKR